MEARKFKVGDPVRIKEGEGRVSNVFDWQEDLVAGGPFLAVYIPVLNKHFICDECKVEAL